MRLEEPTHGSGATVVNRKIIQIPEISPILSDRWAGVPIEKYIWFRMFSEPGSIDLSLRTSIAPDKEHTRIHRHDSMRVSPDVTARLLSARNGYYD